MKIRDLKLRNFRGVRDLTLRALPDTVFLTGQNGQGKTTILHAIQMALFGRCYDGAGKRIANGDLVGPAGSSAEITLVMHTGDRKLTWSLDIPASGSTTLKIADAKGPAFPRAKGPKEIRAAFWAWALPDADPRHAECAANPRAYLLGDDLGVLLSELVGGDFTNEQLEAFAGDRWEWLEGYMNAHPSVSLDNLGDQVTRDRTQSKKDLAAAQAKAAELEAVEVPKKPDGGEYNWTDFDPVKARLETCRATLADLQGELALAKNGGGTETLHSLEGDVEKSARAAEAAEQKHEVALSDEEAARKALKSAEERFRHASEMLRMTEMEIQTCTSQLAEAETSNGCCPFCAEKYKASTKKRLITEVRAALHKAQDRRETQTKAKQDAEKALSEATVDKETAQKRLLEAQEAHTRAEERATAAVKALEAHEAAPKPRPLAEIQVDIDKYQAQEEKGRGVMAALESLVALEEIRGDLEFHTEQVDALEWAVTAFAKGEFRNSLLGDTKAQFEDCVNAELGRFGYRLEVRIEGASVAVHLGRVGGAMVPVAQASKGERLLAEYAVAVAWAPGTPILLDDIDSLSSENKALFMDGLTTWNVSQRIVAGAWGLRDTNVDALREYMGDGDVIYLEQSAAASRGCGAAA